MGYDEIHLHNVGRNQAEFIEVFGREVLPNLRLGGESVSLPPPEPVDAAAG
jgi:predicted esterase